MTARVTTPIDSVHIHRACVQSRVIEGNLTHLTELLSKAGSGLDDDLASFAHRFGRLVRRLNYANAVDQAGMTEKDDAREAPEKPEEAVGV